ncbi:glyoxalase [Novosphingobium sp. PC22D]|uniref:VOC family protein n=1 Tax=Novosphingobium sp. PC22D TaxID=1962403 RepID=UPI000BF175B2|nr:VOC family protein [Novosphingobium sp. PC22D]PEQ10805.1 glyoxalase [Novosphingobium sp. PC22D]
MDKSLMQQISLVTLGVADPARAKRFYAEGFGWAPVFEMDDLAFYQMNGLVFGIWDKAQLAEDMLRPAAAPGSIALAHNVASREAVDAAISRLLAAGATLLRAADAPPHGGYRGYVADPDGHAWEIAWNPAWAIEESGAITFAL